MSQLAEAVDAAEEVWTIDTMPTSPFLEVEDELVEIRSRYPEHIYQPTQELLPPKIRVRRGFAGTTAASHADTTTLTPAYGASAGGVGGAGVTLDNTVDPPAEVTTIIAPRADVSTPGEAVLSWNSAGNLLYFEEPFDFESGDLGEPDGMLFSAAEFEVGDVILWSGVFPVTDWDIGTVVNFYLIPATGGIAQTVMLRVVSLDPADLPYAGAHDGSIQPAWMNLRNWTTPDEVAFARVTSALVTLRIQSSSGSTTGSAIAGVYVWRPL